MPAHPATPDNEPRQFPITDWELVSSAGSPPARSALGRLIAQYLPALRAYLVHRKGLAAHDADDLLQAFVSDKLLEHNLVAQATPARGKFRTLLLTALERFWVSDVRHQHALKRGGGAPRQGDDAAEHVPDHAPRPEEVFDLAWAKQVVDQALQQMETECRRSQRNDVWAVFNGRVLRPMHDQPASTYAELVTALKLRSEDHAANLLVTAKRMFTRHMEHVVRAYAGDDAEVKVEVAELRAILARGSEVYQPISDDLTSL